MKKYTITALLAVSLTSLSLIVAEASPTIKFDIAVSKNGETISTSTITSKNGKEVPLEISKESNYRAQATRQANGDIKHVTGVVKSGLFANLKPELQQDGNIKVDFMLKLSDLVSMKTVTLDNGLTVDMPEVNNLTINEKVLFTNNTPVTLHSGEYSINVTASKI